MGAACVRTDCPFTAALESFALKCWFVRTLVAGAAKIRTPYLVEVEVTPLSVFGWPTKS